MATASRTTKVPVTHYEVIAEPLCEVGQCADNPAGDVATYLLPRLGQEDGEYVVQQWVLACTTHTDGWWDKNEDVAYRYRYALEREEHP